jgi:hypothetical protein
VLVRSTPAVSVPPRRGAIALGGVIVVALAIVVIWQAGPLRSGLAAGSPSPQAGMSAGPTATAEPTTTAAAPTPSPTVAPPTEPPPPPKVVSALTGLLIDPEAALRHPIAVMVDDHVKARPQSGFNAASIVWQAPAEGGVPRYMLIFGDQVPSSVGPIRSAREYYLEWAAEWKAMYVHYGASPEAKATLSRKGHGQWVWNADGFRWDPRYMWRVDFRVPPHNVYTDGEHLRALANRLGADDGPLEPAWTFGAGWAASRRPVGSTVTVMYPYETVTYRYDAAKNRYVRFINDAASPQVDPADGAVVAPTNVVILRMRFGLSDSGHYRLDASNVGKGEAWISTNGVTVKGTWKKASVTAPTLLFGPDGKPVTLTAGQTFVQVLPLSYGYRFTEGVLPVTPPSGAMPEPV